MENVEYTTYESDVLSLVRTMVVKLEEVATVDNTLLVSSGYAVSTDPTTWRYYLNMNGQYHVADTQMLVKSLDDGTTIVFNIANLAIHIATRRAYLAGDYLYERLVADYPSQRDLINGILDPIDLTTAINADNYTILRYNADLVLDNENQLIPRLQDWINSVTAQHFGTDYFTTDNLMLPICIATIYGLMPSAIMTIREEAIGTRYAHTFHVWSEINSHGDFSQYQSSLTTDQVMWLYRNISWLIENAGKRYTFDLLVQNLLTVRDIPLSRYVTTLGTTTLLADQVASASFKLENINAVNETATSATTYTPEDILDKEVELARDNALMEPTTITTLERKGKYSLHSDVRTKLLESSMEDYTNRHVDTLMNTLYHEWVHLSNNSLYAAIIDVTEGSTGNQLRLGVQDALVLWTYLTMDARGEDTTNIPYVYYQNVLKLTVPKLAELQAAGSARYLTTATCNLILGLYPGVSRLISPDTFYDKALSIYLLRWQHAKIAAQYNDFNKFARVRRACDQMYASGYVKPATQTTFAEWFTDNEIDVSTLTADEKVTLAWDIFQKATGWDVNDTSSLRTIQADLIALMLKLSSYTIQVYVEMDDGNVTIEAINRIQGGFVYDATSMTINSQGVFLPLRLRVIPSLDNPMEITNLKQVSTEDPLDFSNGTVIKLPMSMGLTYATDLPVASAAFLPLSLRLNEI